jgi:methionyl-tRNA formyltransferase
MINNSYIVATIKDWNIKIYNEKIKLFPGNWYLVTTPEELLEKVKSIKPKYVFFPHWSLIVSDGILNLTECVCFHCTNLPFGRGGSPVQNLICRGYKETFITALKMTNELDAGDIYLKEPLSLEGLAEEIYIRMASKIADMIEIIITTDITPEKQVGNPTVFKRRKPEESRVGLEIFKINELFDHIRMLDAESYPKAFITYGGFRYEITRPALRNDGIHADVKISEIKNRNIQ